MNFDEIVKNLKTVTPAEAGVQKCLNLLDSRFRGNDENEEIATFYESINFGFHLKFACLPVGRNFDIWHFQVGGDAELTYGFNT